MPALGNARTQAVSVVCRSNLHQLVLGNIAYACENRDFLVPAASDFWDNAGYHRWHGVRDSLDKEFDPRRGPLAEYLGDGKVKQCPESVDFIKSPDWDVSFEKGCGGYGYNMTYLGSRLWESSSNLGMKETYAQTTKMSEVGRCDQTLMFADTAFYQHGHYLIEYSFAEPRFWVYRGTVMTGSTPSPSIHFRHKGHANVGWVDGHVGSGPMADFCGTNSFYAALTKMKLGWFEPVDNTLFDLN